MPAQQTPRDPLVDELCRAFPPRMRTVPEMLTRQERRSLKEHALAVIQKGALDRDALMAELKQVLPEPVRPERREARA